ncbi:MAG TPA: hypothetical protein PKD64_15310 [Pirellulaceae bacterium]|nr:hypothetical protein [Pirellulaceae bacterium]
MSASHFRGQKKEAPPLPMDQRPFVVSRLPIGSLKPVRQRLRKDLPASDYSPFIVELFAFEDLLRYPVNVTSPAVGLTVNRLPTLAHVERPLREEANPMGGFAREYKVLLTHFGYDGLLVQKKETNSTEQVCPHRPYSSRGGVVWEFLSGQV